MKKDLNAQRYIIQINIANLDIIVHNVKKICVQNVSPNIWLKIMKMIKIKAMI